MSFMLSKGFLSGSISRVAAYFPRTVPWKGSVALIMGSMSVLLVYAMFTQF